MVKMLVSAGVVITSVARTLLLGKRSATVTVNCRPTTRQSPSGATVQCIAVPVIANVPVTTARSAGCGPKFVNCTV